MTFTEQSDLETGFAEIYQTRVGPALAAIEHERVDTLKKARLYGIISLLIGAAGVALFALVVEGQFAIFMAVVSGMLGIFGALTVRGHFQSKWAGKVEDIVMPAVCDHVGDLNFSSNGGGRFPTGTFRDLRIVGSYNRSTVKNLLSGTHFGTAFEIVEAHLQHKSSSSGKNSSSSTTTVFRGLLFRIAVPVESPGKILIARDFGSVGNTLSSLFTFGKGRGMPKVTVDHPRFESLFEVHAENPDAAREFLPNAFLDSLLDIADTQSSRGAKGMKAGFQYTSFYLALSQSKGFMSFGKLTTPVADIEQDLHGIFSDIELAHRVIDKLHGAA